jgi:xanthine dehydrogenase YagR molybdenum-binding subunit
MKNSLGKPIDRADARLKVTGAARYSAEIKTEKLTCAVFVGSAIAKGKIKTIDVKFAENSSGVLAVLTHENSPPMKKPSETFDMNGASSGGAKKELPTNSATSVLPLQSPEIFYRGQAVACVVAETFEQAEHAAHLVKVEYAEEKPLLDLEKNRARAEQPEQKEDDPTDKADGDAETALKNFAVKIDEIYRTPLENQNAIEPHATLAEFLTDGSLVIRDATRYVQGVKKMFAESFDLPKDKIRVLAKFVGGAFGSKGPIRPHVALAAMCAMRVKRPVKLVLTRRQMTETTGHRADTRQRVALGASKDGKLNAIIHEGFSTCSATDEFVEPFTKQTYGLYAAPNRKVAQKI